MEKLSFDAEDAARVRALSHSKSSLKCTTRSLISKSISRSRASPDFPDASMRKRVKFAGSRSICELGENQSGHLLQNEVGGAKTSEFKFFKNLLEKVAQKHYFDELATSDINLKKDIAMDCKEGPSNVIQSKSAFRRSSLDLQDFSSVAQGFICSPARLSQKHHEKAWTRSTLFSNVTPMAQLFHPSPQILGENGGRLSGPRHECKETFSRKRTNLLQLGAETCSQTVDDFLSNRSVFILEILQRLGIGRNSNEYAMLQDPEQERRGDHQFLTSSERSNHIVEFCDKSRENLYISKPGLHNSLLACDDTDIHAFPYKHSLKTNFDCQLWKSDFNEKVARLLPDINNRASSIDLSNVLDCNKNNYHDEALSLLNSPCDIAELKVFPIDQASYMGPPYKNLHFNSVLDHKELHEFCFTKSSSNTCNVEIDGNNHEHYLRNHDSFQADCVLPNSYNIRSFQEESPPPCINEYSIGLYIENPAPKFELSKEEFAFHLPEWDANVEKDMPDFNCLVPKVVNHFPTILHDTLGLHDEIGSLSLTNDYRGKSFSPLQSCSFDILFQDPTHQSNPDVGIYSSSPIPGSLMFIQNSPDDNDHSSIDSDFHWRMVKQTACEDDMDFMGASIFGITDLPLSSGVGTILGYDNLTRTPQFFLD